MFGRRPDATPVRELSTMRRFMPYVSPRRNDSLFYMMQQIEVEAALEYLEKRNRERPTDRPITLFHLFLRSCGHAIHLRPGVNRFVKAGRLWQRDGVWLTFSAKREIKGGHELLLVHLPAVASVKMGANEPRFLDWSLRPWGERADLVTVWALADLPVDLEEVGVAGSATIVDGVRQSKSPERRREMISGGAEAEARQLFERIKHYLREQ